MELTVKDRLVLRMLLPEKGNAITFRVVEGLHRQLSFSAEEIEQYELEQDEANGPIRWNTAKDQPREFPISHKARDIIEAALTRLDEQGEIGADTYPIWLKFMGEEEE